VARIHRIRAWQREPCEGADHEAPENESEDEAESHACFLRPQPLEQTRAHGGVLLVGEDAVVV